VQFERPPDRVIVVNDENRFHEQNPRIQEAKMKTVAARLIATFGESGNNC